MVHLRLKSSSNPRRVMISWHTRMPHRWHRVSRTSRSTMMRIGSCWISTSRNSSSKKFISWVGIRSSTYPWSIYRMPLGCSNYPWCCTSRTSFIVHPSTSLSGVSALRCPSMWSSRCTTSRYVCTRMCTVKKSYSSIAARMPWRSR